MRSAAVGWQKAKQPCQRYLCRRCKCAARVANQSFTAPSRPLDNQVQCIVARRCRAGPRTRCGLVRGALSLSHECAMTIAARKRDSNTRRGARVHDEPERRSSARGTMRRGAQTNAAMDWSTIFSSSQFLLPSLLFMPTQNNLVQPARGSHTAIPKPKFSSRAPKV